MNYENDKVQWEYHDDPPPNKDSRKLVTLESEGMIWIGIRYWNFQERRWYNGNDPEVARVRAWLDLPEPAKGVWVHGELI